MRNALIIPAMVAVVAAGCQDPDPATGPGDLSRTPELLDASVWMLVELPGGGGADLPARSTLRFDPEGGRVSGSAGCNNYFGPYSLSDTGIRFGALAATKRLCGDAAVMDQEAQFLAAMGEVDDFAVSSERLVLRLEGGRGALAFIPAEGPGDDE